MVVQYAGLKQTAEREQTALQSALVLQSAAVYEIREPIKRNKHGYLQNYFINQL